MRLPTNLFIVVALCCASCGRSRSHAESDRGAKVVVGKLLIQTPAIRSSKTRHGDDAEKFLDDQIVILRSPNLRKTSQEALLKEHADWKPDEITLDVARPRGGSVISLIGRGGSTDCARSLINLMMDAYLASIGPVAPNGSTLKTDSAKLDKELQEAERAWNGFKLDNDMAHLPSNLASLQRRLKQLSSAKSFYQQEMDSSPRLSLEQDIERRRQVSALPPDMPAEFAGIARISPTPSELAYLTALRQTNAAATEAARKEATVDRESRLDSYRRQIETLGELTTGIQAEIEKINTLQQQSQKIEQAYVKAESAYKAAKESEVKDGIASYNSVSPNVAASIVERASVATDGN